MMKIRRKNGEARLVVIMAMIAAVLAIIAILPMLQSFSDEKVRSAADEKYEIAAERKMLVEYYQSGETVVMAFDGYTKQFVAPRDARYLVPYGNLEEHEGKVLLLTLTDGKVDLQWCTPNEIAEGNYAEKTYR